MSSYKDLSPSFSNILPFLVITILAIMNYLICYPGFLSLDSFMQYSQAQSFDFSNHHPPSMSVIWYLCNQLIDGPQLMLAINMLMMWGSIALLYETFKKDFPYASLFLVLVPFSPSIIANSQMIWKDVFMGNIVLFISSLSFFCYYKKITNSKRFYLFIILLLILFIGVSAKFQAKFIAPLILALMFHGILKMKIKRAILYGLTGAFLFVLISISINHFLEIKNNRSEQLRQFFDLAGISVCENNDLLPSYFRKNEHYSFEKLKSKYNPIQVEYLFGNGKDNLYMPASNEAEFDDLNSKFFKATISHFKCYLQHRSQNFYHLNSVRAMIIEKIDHLGAPEESRIFYDYNKTYYLNNIATYISSFKSLTRGALFLTINIIFLVLCAVNCLKAKSYDKEYFTFFIFINSICIGYFITLFFTTMAAENRYLYVIRLLISIFLPLQIAAIYKAYFKKKVPGLLVLLTTLLCLGAGYNKVRLREFPINTIENTINDISIVIPSCDRYSKLWPAHFHFLFKNWPELLTEYKSIPIYLTSNFKKFENPRITNVLVGEDKSWSDNLLKTLESVNSEFTLIILEDYIIDKPVEQNRLQNIIEIMNKLKAPYIQLNKVEYNSKNTRETIFKDIYKKTQLAEYRNSLQAGLWRTSFLKSLLKHGESAWDFELKGNLRTQKIKNPFLIVDDQPLFSYLNLVTKGNYNSHVIKYMNEQGYEFEDIDKID